MRTLLVHSYPRVRVLNGIRVRKCQGHISSDARWRTCALRARGILRMHRTYKQPVRSEERFWKRQVMSFCSLGQCDHCGGVCWCGLCCHAYSLLCLKCFSEFFALYVMHIYVCVSKGSSDAVIQGWVESR